MRTLIAVILAAMCVAGAASAAPADMVAANTRPFAMEDGRLSGPGADFLEAQTAQAQFVLFGETHHDHDTPLFAAALYRMLRDRHGVDRLVVEIDPVAVETINTRAYRGNAGKIAELAKAYPSHIGFASDQDLAMLALGSETSRDGDARLWGIEQAQGAARYLEELERLAPTPALKARIAPMLAQARREDRTNMGVFVHDDPASLPALEALKADWKPKPGSRAEYLLTNLINTVEIYAYNRRANGGERVGLYNNTVREALFKQHFMDLYRPAAKGGKTPKAMFKFGGWHMYRGRSPGGAFTIGSFAHEFAIANGSEAYGIQVIALGGYNKTYADHPAWMKPILPAEAPTTPVVIDLRPLKPYAREFTSQVASADQWQLRDFIHGHDALVILPGSAKATWDLTGFAVP